MRLLLDTHALIWWSEQPEKLPAKVYSACYDRRNTLLISIASVWEMQIKVTKGKLALRVPLADIIATQQRENGIEILPVKLQHLWKLAELPPRHGDPFDRLLVAQSIAEEVFLISADRVFSEYPVNLFW